MKGVNAVYNGKIVDRHKFRAFIYNSDGQKKLVESWDEYEKHMQTGIWFSRLKDAQAIKAIEQEVQQEKPKKRAKKEKKEEVIVESDNTEKINDQLQEAAQDDAPNDLAYEVTEDDFLPK